MQMIPWMLFSYSFLYYNIKYAYDSLNVVFIFISLLQYQICIWFLECYFHIHFVITISNTHMIPWMLFSYSFLHYNIKYAYDTFNVIFILISYLQYQIRIWFLECCFHIHFFITISNTHMIPWTLFSYSFLYYNIKYAYDSLNVFFIFISLLQYQIRIWFLECCFHNHFFITISNTHMIPWMFSYSFLHYNIKYAYDSLNVVFIFISSLQYQIRIWFLECYFHIHFFITISNTHMIPWMLFSYSKI